MYSLIIAKNKNKVPKRKVLVTNNAAIPSSKLFQLKIFFNKIVYASRNACKRYDNA